MVAYLVATLVAGKVVMMAVYWDLKKDGQRVAHWAFYWVVLKVVRWGSHLVEKWAMHWAAQ